MGVFFSKKKRDKGNFSLPEKDNTCVFLFLHGSMALLGIKKLLIWISAVNDIV